MKTYFPYQIERMSNRDIRKAYSDLRKTANKRLANLEKNNLGGYGAFRFAKLEQIHADDVGQELAELSRFMRDPRHTVRGAREHRNNILDSLHEKPGFEDINESNFRAWTEYMDLLREKYGNKLFDSGDATDVFMEAERLDLPANIIKNHYNLFKNNLEEIRRIDKIENAKDPGRAIRLKDFKAAIADVGSRRR